MISRQYVEDFKKLGFGMFVHFGLFSVLGQGEWALDFNEIPQEEYAELVQKFDVDKNFAKELVACAKRAGCRYITLTTRHHDGFSLFDTKGLSDYDVMHSPTGRDLVKEFADECHKQGIVPFFYHTLMDWYEPKYKNDFKGYLKYLRASIELLCTNYGTVGGFWFDGMWDKPDCDWEEDELYGLIRKYQPNAMIINNTGLACQGQVGHPELDSVTFERGKPAAVDGSDRPRAGELCQILNSTWGYAEADIGYRGVREIIEEMTSCRRYGCNCLLNVGPLGNGLLKNIERDMLEEIGQWTKMYGEAFYNVTPSDCLTDENDDDFIVHGSDADYLFVYGLGMSASKYVNIVSKTVKEVRFFTERTIEKIVWMDNEQPLNFTKNGYTYVVNATNFSYGINYVVRVAKIKYAD